MGTRVSYRRRRRPKRIWCLICNRSNSYYRWYTCFDYDAARQSIPDFNSWCGSVYDCYVFVLS